MYTGAAIATLTKSAKKLLKQVLGQDDDSAGSASARVSLIMCTLAQRDSIGRLLRSLQSQTNRNFELVIVDQAEHGVLSALLQQGSYNYPVRVVRSLRGLSRARNVGLANARGEIIGFPDDDCWYGNTLVESVCRRFQASPDMFVLTGRTVDASHVESNGKFMRASGKVTRANVWYAGNSNCVFVRRKVFEAVGVFDESLGVGSGSPYGAGEESDLLLRAISSGFVVQFAHDLTVFHDQVNFDYSGPTLQKAQLYSQGFGRTLRLNGYSFAYAAFRATRSLLAAVLAFGRGNVGLGKLKLIWVRGTLAGFLPSIDQRERLRFVRTGIPQ